MSCADLLGTRRGRTGGIAAGMTDVDAVWYPEQSLCPLPQQLSRSAPPEGATSAMAVAARVLPSLEVAVLDAKPTDALRYGIERMCSSIFPAGQTRVDAGAAEPDALPDSLDLLAMRAAPELARITLHVARPDEPLALGVDESYHLVVQRHAAALSAGTVWGLLRGLETFAQVRAPRAPSAATGSALTLHLPPHS